MDSRYDFSFFKFVFNEIIEYNLFMITNQTLEFSSMEIFLIEKK